MSLLSFLPDIVISIVTSYFFWLFTFVVTRTSVLFSDTIEESDVFEDGAAQKQYRVRLTNYGHRDLLEVEFVGRLQVKLEKTRTTYINVGSDQVRPILKGYDRSRENKYTTILPDLRMKEAAYKEFEFESYSPRIREKARNRKLTLEDIFNEYPQAVSLIFYAMGNDRVTGARKVFVSKEYTADDIIRGKFKKWSWKSNTLKDRFFGKKKIIGALSAIDRIPDEPHVEQKIRQTEIDVIDVLNNTNPGAKDAFLQDQSKEKPDNEYGGIDIDAVNEKLTYAHRLLEEMQEDKEPGFPGDAYAEILKYNINKLLFVKANYEYVHNEGDKADIAREHARLNRYLYGVPDEAVFKELLAKKTGAEKHDGDSSAIFTPTDEVFNRFADVINGYLYKTMRHIPAGKESFTAEEACDIANEILRDELGADAYGWHALVVKSGTIASVLPFERVVKFPGNRSKGDYTYEDLKAILAHEIAVHAARCISACNSEFYPLSVGLPFYEAFEEGVARAVESAVKRKYEQAGYMHYLSIGFVYFQHMNFREVFEAQLSIWGRDETTRKLVFDSVQRALRGTGELLNSKDLVYFNGAEKAWRYITEHIDEPTLIEDLFFSGKTDMTNPLHREILSKW